MTYKKGYSKNKDRKSSSETVVKVLKKKIQCLNVAFLTKLHCFCN